MYHRYSIYLQIDSDQENSKNAVEGLLTKKFLVEEFPKLYPNATIIVKTAEKDAEDYVTPLFVFEDGKWHDGTENAED